MQQYNEETKKWETYTPNGRNIDKMERSEIIDYLGLNDNISDKQWYEILEQAETIERVYHNKMIDYCLIEDYKSHIEEITDIIIGRTRDLIIFIREE